MEFKSSESQDYLSYSKRNSNTLDRHLNTIRELLNTHSGLYIFGAKLNGKKCIDYCKNLGIVINGFIDNDPAKIGESFYGYKIFPLNSVNKNSIILNSSGRYSIEINSQLKNNYFLNSVNFTDFLYSFNLPYQAESNIRNYTNEILINSNKIKLFFDNLQDDLSRRTLASLINFRQTLNPQALEDVISPYEDEFFPKDKDLLNFNSDGIFIDGGAYDGDSYLRYLSRNPKNPSAYLFEPDSKIYHKALKRLVMYPEAKIFNVCLHSQDGQISFLTTGGMDGSISKSGNQTVKAMRIDSLNIKKIAHIKLDVEGAEEDVLLGAINKIQNDHPSLAIACYHKSRDIWYMYQFLKNNIDRPYHYYLRHYSQTLDDTILYAIPQG